MRPIHLRFAAFGPYAGQTDIDFTRFEDGLFLVCTHTPAATPAPPTPLKATMLLPNSCALSNLPFPLRIKSTTSAESPASRSTPSAKRR